MGLKVLLEGSEAVALRVCVCVFVRVRACACKEAGSERLIM